MCKELQLMGDFVPQTPYRGYAPGPHWGSSVPRTSFILGLSGGNFSPPQKKKKFRNSSKKFDETEEPEGVRDEFTPYLLGPNHWTF